MSQKVSLKKFPEVKYHSLAEKTSGHMLSKGKKLSVKTSEKL
jgi:hypothetical protein